MKTDKLREECAVFGVSANTDEAAGITYNALLAMQHRGQEGSGIAVLSGSAILYHKDIGLVSDVFSGEVLEKLPKSSIAVGHNRYSTTGANARGNTGPFVTEYLTGRIATAHNGNVTNADEIKRLLVSNGVDFRATSDSEVVSSLIAYNCMRCGDTAQGVVAAAKLLKGAFSLVVLTSENKIVAIRDANGFRPLCVGQNSHGAAVASESCALECCGFSFTCDVLPGECVIIENGRIESLGVVLSGKDPRFGLCVFEYIYFARPDSVIDGLSVYEARVNMGRQLAREYPVDADAVCGVPDSGLDAAVGYSAESGIPLVAGFVKNRYIGRSFIYPTQTQRANAVKMKLNPLATNISGRRIVLVDDSIVRGTTSERIVRSLRDSGAKEVHMRSSAPPFKFTCQYGTDIDDEEALIANNLSIDGIRRKIGADTLGYISIDGVRAACAKCLNSFCDKCFTGSGEEAGRNRKNVFEAKEETA
jgi:amidophosphoribosyltransferase